MLRAFLSMVLAVSSLVYELTPSRTALRPGTLAAGSLSPGSPMIEPRSGHAATLLEDGRVLIVGGMRRNQDFYRSAELYDPATGKFEPAGEMSAPRVGLAAVLLGSGKVLVAGGYVGIASTDLAELYDPRTGKFILLPKMTSKRGRPTATLLLNGDVLITGGAEDNSPAGVRTAEVFRADRLKFEAVGAMHFERIGQTATVLADGRVLIAGGRGATVTASAELYDPATGKFRLTGNMMTARYKHSAGLLPDGRVLIAGGSDARDWNGTMTSAEIYDPRTQKFSATAPLNNSRFKLPDEAVRLASGKLLIAGGSKTVEVYDPVSGKFFVAAGEMDDARHFMTETALPDGSVLLAGGYPNSDRATAATWIYHP